MNIEPNDLPAEAKSLGAVRELVCQEAEVEISDPVVLVANELAANTIARAPGGFTVRIHGGPRVRIEITHAAPSSPASPARVAGWPTDHGASIVDALSERWGIDVDHGRVTAWAEVAV